MGSNFSKIKIGTIFQTSDEESFKKTSELTFDDMAGIEHYIDPFFDKKIGGKASTAIGIDTSARVVKSNEEVPKAEKAPKKSAKKKSAKK